MTLTLRITVGIPASGKSTAARAWMDRGAFGLLLSSDETRQELTGSMEDFTQDDQVWTTIEQRATQALGAGYSTMIDATNLVPEFRARWYRLGKHAEATVEAFLFPITLHEALHRNLKRERQVPSDIMLQMWDKWQRNCSPETLRAEGFDRVYA